MTTLESKLKAAADKRPEDLDYLDKEVAAYIIGEPQSPHEYHVENLQILGKELRTRKERIAASEMVWGVAAHAVKKIAAERGWPTKSHQSLSAVVEWLASEYSETGAPDAAETVKVVSAGWNTAQAAHSNYYDDVMTPSMLEANASIARDFVSALGKMHRGVPSDLEIPAFKDYRNLLKINIRDAVSNYTGESRSKQRPARARYPKTRKGNPR